MSVQLIRQKRAKVAWRLRLGGSELSSSILVCARVNSNLSVRLGIERPHIPQDIRNATNRLISMTWYRAAWRQESAAYLVSATLRNSIAIETRTESLFLSIEIPTRLAANIFKRRMSPETKTGFYSRLSHISTKAGRNIQ